MKSNLTEKWIVCRVCLKQPKELMKTIFDNDESNDLTRMILECGGVPIKQFDHYPDKICNRCLRYLRVAYKFRVTCQRSHNHLSRFIAPVVVDKVDVELQEITDIEEMDADGDGDAEGDVDADGDGDGIANGDGDGEELALKLEPGEVVHIKQELVEVIDEADIMEMYEPIEVEENGKFESIDELDEFIDCEELTNTDTAMSDGVEYLDDVVEEPTHTSDEEYFPSPRATQKKNIKKSPTKVDNIVKPSTSQAIKKEKSAKTVKKVPKRRNFIKDNIQYICDICGNKYPSQGRLTEHIKLHKGIKPHDCEICGHAFAQTQQLARHMNTHTGNRPYKCTYCPAAFADLSTRNKHHRIHTNERPYVCDVCGKAFTYTNTLKFHKMIHTGEKPFVCDICGKGFQQAYKLRNHKQTHAKKGIGIKIEKVEVEELTSYQEDYAATAQLLEI